jgi:hypothetical protein
VVYLGNICINTLHKGDDDDDDDNIIIIIIIRIKILKDIRNLFLRELNERLEDGGNIN